MALAPLQCILLPTLINASVTAMAAAFSQCYAGTLQRESHAEAAAAQVIKSIQFTHTKGHSTAIEQHTYVHSYSRSRFLDFTLQKKVI
uniref:Secreted protein n=1 Tax=Anguilla anguilla TaxID=7936 RepID=A0A0E9XDQ6_ANGAN